MRVEYASRIHPVWLMSDLDAPLTPEEAARAANASTSNDGRWAREEIAEQWAEAKQEPGDLARTYAEQRGLDLALVGPVYCLLVIRTVVRLNLPRRVHKASKLAQQPPSWRYPA